MNEQPTITLDRVVRARYPVIVIYTMKKPASWTPSIGWGQDGPSAFGALRMV